ncbi:FAD/NAD(P)-binding domain-containing protein [Aspergillus avenaceus]|uniref:FAD/NAD(P)-binding domain-containing protein n=1 Tax=Aspergillus avenaceus TaxID=36643 RepID=A0A5N6U152_ASPAV|nr:FAD/NAD(P)-binding domain-containing protein [Aspergillus avenaceus]
MSPSPIAIIGAGPCGLTFARLLGQNNIDYIVFERDESAIPMPHQLGGTLDIHGTTGQEAIKRAGLFEKFSQLARWDAQSFVVQDPTRAINRKFSGGRDAPEIDRVQLRRLLLDSIPAHKVRWGHGVKRVEKAADGDDWIIFFSNDTTASNFRLIVGADGAWSKVRPLLTPVKPEYSGKLFIQGRISHDNPRYADALAQGGRGNMMAIGHGRQIGVQQVADGSYQVHMGILAAEDLTKTTLNVSDTEGTRRQLLSSPNYYPGFAPELRDFIANAEGPFYAWRLYRMPVESMSWKRVPGVTLLGDAAHVSTPFAGEGVNCSMFDALRLVDCVLKYCGSGYDDDQGNMEQAVMEYESEMFVRAKDLISRSMAFEEIIYSDDAARRLVAAFDEFGKEE